MNCSKQVAQLIKENSQNGAFSGVVAIWQAEEPMLEHACGLAHRGLRMPNKLDTRFRLASIGKMFTAVSILQLIDQNQFQLDTRIHYPKQALDVVILGNQSWCAGALGWEIHDLIVNS